MRPNEGVQRFEQDAVPPQEEGQAPRNPPAQLNSGPAESGAAARPPVEGRVPGVFQTVGVQPNNNSPLELSGQLPVTNQAAEALPPRHQAEGEGAEFWASNNLPSESAVREPRQELLLEHQDVEPPQPLLEEAPLEPLPVPPNNTQPQAVVQTAGATALLPGQSASDQDPPSQAGASLPDLNQNRNNDEPAEFVPTNNDELWAQVLEFLTDCGEI